MTELTASKLTVNDEMVAQLREAISEGRYGLKGVPNLIKLLIRDDMWRERIVRATGEVVRFDRFEEFVSAHVPEGLEADIRTLQRLCADDPEAIDLLDRAMSKSSGNRIGTNQHTLGSQAASDGTVPIINGSTEVRPHGTTVQYAHRRLRTHRPDLHARVLCGEISPHAAMVEAGFRDRTLTVPISRPERIARILRKHLSSEQLAELRRLLAEETAP